MVDLSIAFCMFTRCLSTDHKTDKTATQSAEVTLHGIDALNHLVGGTRLSGLFCLRKFQKIRRNWLLWYIVYNQKYKSKKLYNL